MSEQAKYRAHLVACVGNTLLVLMTGAALEIRLFRLGLWAANRLDLIFLAAAITAGMIRMVQLSWPNRRSRLVRELYLAGTLSLWGALLFLNELFLALGRTHR